MGLIGMLAAFIVPSLNLAKNFITIRDLERRHNSKQIENAMFQTLIDTSVFPQAAIIPTCTESTKTTCAKPICRLGVSAEICEENNSVHLEVLVPEYIADLPVDIVMPDDERCTGFMVFQNAGYVSIYSANIGKLAGDAPEGTCGLGWCGNASMTEGEACDDGNTVAGDGCSATCTIEPMHTCTGSPSVCAVLPCGNGSHDDPEECDDGNTSSGDGCSNICVLETNSVCTGSPSACTTCQDGFIGTTDQCLVNLGGYNYDMGDGEVASGFTKVIHTTLYTPAQGYGWDTIANGQQTFAGTALTQDGVFADTMRTFSVNLPNTLYDVKVTIFDSAYIRNHMDILFEGVQVEDKLTVPINTLFEKTYYVNVQDSQLNFSIDDKAEYCPTCDWYWKVSGLEIKPTTNVLSSMTAENEETLEAANAVTNITFNTVIDASTLTTSDIVVKDALGNSVSVVSVSQVNDKSSSPDKRTFAVTFVASANFGTYTIEVGPDVTSHGGYKIDANGDHKLGEPGVDILSANFTVVEWYRKFDMGNPAHPLMTGYVLGECQALYNATTGHGWVGSIASATDRGAPDYLKRDMCFSGGPRTFVVDVPTNGTFNVRLIAGDVVFSRDLMRFTMEGVLMDTLSSAGGVFNDKSYVVTVSDGQFTLDISDGGGDPAWVLNGLEIVPQ